MMTSGKSADPCGRTEDVSTPSQQFTLPLMREERYSRTLAYIWSGIASIYKYVILLDCGSRCRGSMGHALFLSHHEPSIVSM